MSHAPGGRPPTARDAPGGYIAPNPGDCSDADGQIYPGAADPDDDIDQDCDGVAGKEPKSCGCAPAGPAPGAVLGLLVATMVIRRRRA